MTQDEIIELAEQAGISKDHAQGMTLFLEAFAKLVAEREREELADKIAQMPFGDTSASFAVWVREQA
jgi:hypothetical protein